MARARPRRSVQLSFILPGLVYRPHNLPRSRSATGIISTLVRVQRKGYPVMALLRRQTSERYDLRADPDDDRGRTANAGAICALVLVLAPSGNDSLGAAVRDVEASGSDPVEGHSLGWRRPNVSGGLRSEARAIR